ncbi:STAS domain-containing protein [Thermoactinospora rubra]|uniref:STAS domain-containing protein n=1 Tax=Thermoactinospora rubra TaxID=1088767 RepID=UPI0013020769|nr:STAS domain-containing protein [Thermoactinospora rubra]
MPLELRRRLADGFVVIEVEGDLDIATDATFREFVVESLDRDSVNAVVDLSRLSFIGAAGLSSLIGLDLYATTVGGTLRLACSQPVFDRVLRAAGLAGRFVCYPSVEAAMAQSTTPPS